MIPITGMEVSYPFHFPLQCLLLAWIPNSFSTIWKINVSFSESIAISQHANSIARQPIRSDGYPPAHS